MRRPILLLAAAALLLAAALATTAGAKSADRNADRIPDRWERKHHLSLNVKQTKRDQDHDSFDNLAEYRAHTDPRDDDSDEDGTEDGDENAGTVTKIVGDLVTITPLAAGAEPLTAKVTPDTELECRTAGEVEKGERGDDDGARKSDDGDEGERDERDADNGDEEDGDHEDGDDEDGDREDGEHEQDEDEADEREEAECPDGALKPGALVHEAEQSLRGSGPVWTEIELITTS